MDLYSQEIVFKKLSQIKLASMYIFNNLAIHSKVSLTLCSTFFVYFSSEFPIEQSVMNFPILNLYTLSVDYAHFILIKLLN